MRSLVGMLQALVSVIYQEKCNGLMKAAEELKMLNRLLFVPGVEHTMLTLGQFVLGRAEAQRVYGAARVSYNECTRNTLKPSTSTCSYKWRETLKGSIFGVIPSIPAVKGPGDGLVVAPADKASLLGSEFESKQCREQFLTPLWFFSQSMCNSLAFRTSILCLLVDIDTYGGVSSTSKEGCGYYCSKTKHNFL